MAKFTPTLSEVNTGAIQPLAPVEGGGIISDLAPLANLAVEGIKLGTTAGLVSDAKDLEQEYLDSTAQELTAEETAETNDFTKRLQKLQSATKATGRTAEFRIRAEAMLKERLNAFPGLAQHYRRAMSSTLGFDPTGEAAAQRAAALKAGAQSAQQQLDNIDRDAVSLGMVPGEVLSPKGQQKYIALKQSEADLEALRRKAETNRLAKELNSDVRHNVSFEEASATNDKHKLKIASKVNSYILANTNLTEENIKFGLKPEHYEGIDGQVFAELVRQLETDKATYVAEQAALYSDLNPNILDDVRNMSSAIYDEYISRINGKDSLEVANQDADMETHRLIGLVSDSPWYKQLKVLNAIAPGVTLPIHNKLQVKMLANELAMPSIVDPNAEELPIQEVGNSTSEEIQGWVEHLRTMQEALTTTEIGADVASTKGEQIADTFTKMAEGMESGLQESVLKKRVANSYLQLIADPANKEFFDIVRKNNPFASQAVDGFMFQYMHNLSNDTKTKIDRLIQKNTFTTQTPVFQGRKIKEVQEQQFPFIKPQVDARGTVSFVIDEAAVNKHSPDALKDIKRRGGRNIKSPLKKDLETINKTLSADLNRVVRAVANMSDVSTQEAAQVVLRDFIVEGAGGE